MAKVLAAAAVLSTAWFAAAAPVTVPATSSLDLGRQLNDAFVQVADRVSPCVVVIEVSENPETDSSSNGPSHHHSHRWQRYQLQGEGSGVIITEDGYILTNNHVVQGADKIEVRLRDGRKFTAHVRGADPQSDIAVIKIDAQNLPTAVLGDSDKTRVGEFVLAIGAPFELSYSVTVGHVSAKGRAFLDESGGYADQDFLQTDASINPGNSGGPLVNLYGEVIGLNAMIEGMDRGIGFAVPINLAKRVKDHLIAEGKYVRSWIGIGIVSLQDADDYRNFISGLNDGVLVNSIEPDSPAASSDLKPGDVVVSVDGHSVGAARALKDIVSEEPAGKVVSVEVVRNKTRLSIPVKLAAMPGMDSEAANIPASPPATISAPESDIFGLTVQTLTKQLARQYGADSSTGVVVTAVDDGSPADDTGIQEGDIITEVNRKPVRNLHQFRDAIKAGDPKFGELINLDSKGSRRIVVLHDDD